MLLRIQIKKASIRDFMQVPFVDFDALTELSESLWKAEK